MRLATVARDCLYVNWAVPREAAPELPDPLRYDLRSRDGRDWVFVSALLFRLTGLHLQSLPLPRFSYPQMNVRLYVLDGGGVPAVLFVRMLVPIWVVPGSRLLAHQPAEAAHLSFPAPDRDGDDGAGWRWKVVQRRRFEVAGRLGSPLPGPGPDLGPWNETVDFFRDRPRGYATVGNGLRQVSTTHPPVAVWPLAVEVTRAGLVEECLPAVAPELFRAPHSAWLCPEIPFRFALSAPPRPALASQSVPAGC